MLFLVDKMVSSISAHLTSVSYSGLQTKTGDIITASPAIANGLVFVGSQDYKLYAFAADGCGAATCEPLWASASTGFLIESSPAVANDIVYISSWDHKLYAYDIAGGGTLSCAPLWTSTPTGSILESSPTVAGVVVYVAPTMASCMPSPLMAVQTPYVSHCGHHPQRAMPCIPHLSW